MYTVQILGASYGMLLASKLLLAGQRVELICTQDEADRINSEGFRVRLPCNRNHDQAGAVELCSRNLPGEVAARVPGQADPETADLVVLAMQEPQYQAQELQALLKRIGQTKTPCLSIMNMPPLPFLARFSGIDIDACAAAYTNTRVWEHFNPALVSHCSADPQAVRPDSGASNELEVRLATNFRAAPFCSDRHTRLLQDLAEGIARCALVSHGRTVQPPVKLKIQSDSHVGLSKLPMLITGNYRCVLDQGVRSIQQAVHDDLQRSRAVYETVCDVLVAQGSPREALVPFEKYAAAAQSLTAPASAAKAIERGAVAIERVDRLVDIMAQQHGRPSELLSDIALCVDRRLEQNKAAPRR